ncbi:NAD(P)/FAD-dependent oxidoreductase [Pseudomonas sp. NPDC087336]|uniref:NAD(P)/FAD-dependent oxidoreductase n=1 Tax=Pseudomonas sp. NPDC087336 TaxID=3364436 RepID=UPI0038000972
MTLRIRVEGAGVAAWTAAALLARRGCAVNVHAECGAQERIVAVPAKTVALFEDCLGVAIEAMTPSRWVEKRCVAWEGRDLTGIPARALVCDASALAEALRVHFIDEMDASLEHEWVLCAKGRTRGDTVVEAGVRRAVVGRMEIPDGFPNEAMVVAATPGGWIFAVVRPDGDLAVVSIDPSIELVAETVLRESVDFLWPGFGAQVLVLGAGTAAPSFDRTCATQGRIALGDNALALDPLRGDGIGFAVRGALLAQAVLGAIASDGAIEARLDYYRDRLSHVFLGHVRGCAAHYEAAWNEPIWRREIVLMRSVLRRIPMDNKFRFRLIGKELRST